MFWFDNCNYWNSVSSLRLNFDNSRTDCPIFMLPTIESPIEYNDYIKPTTFTSATTAQKAISKTFSGWGKTSRNSSPATQKETEIELSIIWIPRSINFAMVIWFQGMRWTGTPCHFATELKVNQMASDWVRARGREEEINGELNSKETRVWDYLLEIQHV